MSEHYLIAIGGTGSRCLEAIIHLSAAGLFQSPMHVLIIDPDQNNGNSIKVRTLLTSYHALQQAQQPRGAEKKKTLIGWEKLREPGLFQAPFNLKSGTS